VHRLFEQPQEPGLSELLRGEIEVADAIRATTFAGLGLLAAGSYEGRAALALANDGTRPIFDQLRPQYDFVLVDSPPVLPVVDSLLLAQQVDAVLLSILRDVSRLPLVYAAHQRLMMLGIPLLGAVVNGTRDDLYDYRYTTRTNAEG
jgi:Mrp family chromosome partitioning ATPase